MIKIRDSEIWNSEFYKWKSEPNSKKGENMHKIEGQLALSDYINLENYSFFPCHSFAAYSRQILVCMTRITAVSGIDCIMLFNGKYVS